MLSVPGYRRGGEGRAGQAAVGAGAVDASADHPRGMIGRDGTPWSVRTWANLVTVVRVGGSIICFTLAAVRGEAAWNYAGLLIYWSLDLLDGFLARVLRQETRLGAQLDIIADRVLIVFFYYNYLTEHPHLLPAVALFLFQYLGLDLYLSIQFLRWPILSPNYFYLIDRRIWMLNWSSPAKIGNTGLVTGVILLTGAVGPATAVCLGLIIIKLYSWVLLHRLEVPERQWQGDCARRP